MPEKKPAPKKTTPKKTTRKTTPKKKSGPSDISEVLDEIREKAFEIFNHRQANNIPGDELNDWIQAEKLIREKYKLH
jgi:hypothetical protein